MELFQLNHHSQRKGGIYVWVVTAIVALGIVSLLPLHGTREKFGSPLLRVHTGKIFNRCVHKSEAPTLSRRRDDMLQRAFLPLISTGGLERRQQFRISARPSAFFKDGDQATLRHAKVAIIGGGIGGLAMTIALRNLGFTDVQVYEQSRELLRKSTGTGIMFSPNGFAALNVIDPTLVEKVQEAGTVIDKQQLVTKEGEVLKAGGDGFGREWPYQQVNIRWQRFHELLGENAADCTINLGHKLEGMTEDDQGVSLYFRGLNDPVRADFVIGADGVFSNVRKTLFPEIKPQNSGQVLWNALVKTTDLDRPVHPENGVAFEFYEEDGKSGLFFETGEGYTAWYLTKMDPNGKIQSQEGFGGFGRNGAREFILEEFKDRPSAMSLIAATPDSSIFERAIYDIPRIDKWHSENNRIVLLGDAAHAMVPSQGQGTMMTLEDVCELSIALASNSKLDDVFKAFEASRMKRAHVVQELSAVHYMGRPFHKPAKEVDGMDLVKGSGYIFGGFSPSNVTEETVSNG